MADDARHPGAADGVPDVPLADVEDQVSRALASGDDAGLRVLGYGEISLVIGWPGSEPVAACKRLPPFASAEAAAVYARQFDTYLDVLVDKGVVPVSSRFEVLDGSDGGPVAYVVQPVLTPADLGPAVLRRTDPDPQHPLVRGVVDAVTSVIDERTGLDAQISNWAMVDGELRYLDVTTPMRFDATGGFELDTGIFLAAYPWALRGVIGRFVAPGVVDAYRDPRHVLVDLAANLLKEDLEPWVPAVVEAADRVASPTITAAEVRRYYRSDARLWEVMLRLRRADRWWQRTVRRRTYPFLLPGPVAR